QVYGLTPENVSKLTAVQVSGLDAYQLNYFNTNQTNALTIEQVQSINDVTLLGVNGAHIALIASKLSQHQRDLLQL
ncbi:MAG: hypothetical protein JW774_08565, partial [Candidatus Aureabacteria bacterium]|nr:hypothetical protein [Candidatus Auribacterota bacterium]